MDPETTVTDDNTSASSVDDSLLSSPDGDVLSPIVEGDATGEPGDVEIAAGSDTNPAANAAVIVAEGDTGDDTRYDKIPRFQELHKRATAAEAKLSMMENVPALEPSREALEIPVGADGEPLFKDISTMTAAEVREWQEDDPIGFAKNTEEMTLFRISARAQQGQRDEIRKATFAEIGKTFDEYAKNNPDFNEMWEKNELQAYMQAHPGNNAISAHMILTEQKRLAAIVAKTVKETESRVIKNFQAKKNATVINPGTISRSAGDDGVDPALKNTKQFGGIHSVLANKLAESRRKSAGGI